ncbi:MAG: kinetochore-associated Ndc80 complex subunit nuf2 [Alyxoria varia]|nr:MAG: kinetochore-associated Ndc80 complex subunit nuf2 [Alyxoria varia]
MNFNARVSSAQPTPRANPRQNQKREEDNCFILPDHEIAGCISDIGINFTIPDLHKPNPQQIQHVFEWFAQLLMNATRDAVSPAMRAAADDICGQYSEIFSADTRDLMGFYVVMRKLLMECGVQDFTFQDLFKPTRERLVRIFSFIINFIRFRESHTSTIDEHFNKSERTKQRIGQLYHDNQALEDRLRILEGNRRSTEAAVAAKAAQKEELKKQLNGLKADQEPILERVDDMRHESTRLKSILEDKTREHITSQEAVQKLRPYAEQSPGALEANLQELSSGLNSDRQHTENLDRRSRALQTSSDSFTTVATDVRNCIASLNDLHRETQAQEAAALAAAKGKEALSERTNNVRDVEREEKMLNKQLDNVERRTEKLRKNAEDRRVAEGKKMEELKKVNEDIRKERGDRGKEMEKRRVRIEQTEKKMADLKENIDREVHAAHDEYVKMDSHIRLYIKEMEQSIS